MNKELELEAEKYAWQCKNEYFTVPVKADECVKTSTRDYIAGATSKYVEKQKLEFAIKQLNKLDSVLQAKVSLHLDMRDESSDKEFYDKKISGIRLAKEEIRREIRELKQKLSEL
jgi:hypothetical protein